MVNITLAVPKELKKEMEKRPEMNWSEIARQAIKKRIELLNDMDRMLSKSKLTERDAMMLGRKINKAAAKRFREMV